MMKLRARYYFSNNTLSKAGVHLPSQTIRKILAASRESRNVWQIVTCLNSEQKYHAALGDCATIFV